MSPIAVSLLRGRWKCNFLFSDELIIHLIRPSGKTAKSVNIQQQRNNIALNFRVYSPVNEIEMYMPHSPGSYWLSIQCPLLFAVHFVPRCVATLIFFDRIYRGMFSISLRHCIYPVWSDATKPISSTSHSAYWFAFN